MIPVGALQPFIRPITVTGKELGRGAYGQVEIVIDQLTNTRYAAKKFLSVVHIKKFTKELRILSKLEHKNIVQLKGIALPAGEDLPLLLMELLECDLHSRLEASKRGSPLSVYHKLCILHGVSEGLHYLHSQTPEKIIHRDLTAKNVLLDSQLIAKISDFGNSRFISVDEQARMTTNPGTLCYTAPEAICTTVYNERIDIFSFGHLSIFTFIEQFPHDLLPAKVPVGSGRLQALTEVDRRKEYLIKLREQVRHNLGEESMHEFVIMCLDDQPEKRPTTIELISFLELSLQKIKKQPLNDDTIFNLPSTVASQTPSTEDSSSEHIL